MISGRGRFPRVREFSRASSALWTWFPEGIVLFKKQITPENPSSCDDMIRNLETVRLESDSNRRGFVDGWVSAPFDRIRKFPQQGEFRVGTWGFFKIAMITFHYESCALSPCISLQCSVSGKRGALCGSYWELKDRDALFTWFHSWRKWARGLHEYRNKGSLIRAMTLPRAAWLI